MPPLRDRSQKPLEETSPKSSDMTHKMIQITSTKAQSVLDLARRAAWRGETGFIQKLEKMDEAAGGASEEQARAAVLKCLCG